MADDERRPLLPGYPNAGHQTTALNNHRGSKLAPQDEEAASIASSHVSISEQKMGDSSVGERLPYNDYTTIDWLHDLVKDSYRLRLVHSRPGLRYKLFALFDEASGWFVAALIGTLTACVAFLVDVAEATVSDWKLGYCTRNPFLSREACCEGKTPLASFTGSDDSTADAALGSWNTEVGADCPAFRQWADTYAARFAIYAAFAFAFGIVSSGVTRLTKRSLPAVSAADTGNKGLDDNGSTRQAVSGKTMYMAAGSGIPEIKGVLSGFEIPHLLDFKVLVVKAIGAIFAVATGLCLGKEGPFVHISTCMGYLIANLLPKYRDNGRKLREMLSVACAAGLSVAFGAPIGGVLFSYEEISTYFPRKVLWRAFLCSLCAAMVLKALNPTGTGKLVLFETHYNIPQYTPMHYAVFILLGLAGGLFGGVFCRLNLLWSRHFRALPFIKRSPLLETLLVLTLTTLLQYPNPLTRQPGDTLIKTLLTDCRDPASTDTYPCQNENLPEIPQTYLAALLTGTLSKLLLTTITFGVKLPSGIIIPSLDAGALFGRSLGLLLLPDLPPGIPALIGAAAFLAGVSRMTISLCVIMFELTGDLQAVVPHMLAILVAKWVADSLGKESVYDVAQTVLGHPFLDGEAAQALVQRRGGTAAALLPPRGTMEDITVVVGLGGKVERRVLERKLERLRGRGLMDAGVVLVGEGNGILRGYLAEGELEFGLRGLGMNGESEVRVLEGQTGQEEEGVLDLSRFVDRTPLSVCATAPVEYVVEMFGKLGLRYLMVSEEGTGKLVGVVIKKRLLAYLNGLKHE